jgi:hypothetical protein
MVFSYQWRRHLLGCPSWWTVGTPFYLLSKFLPDPSEYYLLPVKRGSDRKNPQNFRTKFRCHLLCRVYGGHYLASGEIFSLQKKIFRIMVGAQHRNTCRVLLQQLVPVSVPCRYILSSMNSLIQNRGIFKTNSSIRNINTRD